MPTFSRKQPIQRQNINLNALVEHQVKMLRRIIREDITIECDLNADVPSVHADSGMMEQVLMNLAVNARDAMPAGGQLFIGTAIRSLDNAHAQTNAEAREGNFICLSVRDTGEGMSAGTLTRIFEPFFTTKESGKGTGLGLSTVYGIVKQHNGWIEVNSHVGTGTTFDVFFPATSSAAVVSPDSLAKSREPQGGTETVLIVEDEPALRKLGRAVLERYGYHVLEAASGTEALSVWRENEGKVDLLLTDMVMPDGLTGRQLAETLRLEKPGLRTVFMSGYSAEIGNSNTGFILRQWAHFLQKPFASRALAETVRKSLDEH